MTPQHSGQDGQTEQPPDNPGDQGELLQGLVEIAGQTSDLDQPLNLSCTVEQGQEMREQFTSCYLAECFLAFTGGNDPPRNCRATQIAFGDAGRGDPHAIDVKHRGPVDLAENEYRAESQFDRTLITLGQRTAYRNADGSADQLQIILEPLFLIQIGLGEADADAERGKKHERQNHEKQQGVLQAGGPTPRGTGQSCIEIERVVFAHVQNLYILAWSCSANVLTIDSGGIALIPVQSMICGKKAALGMISEGFRGNPTNGESP
jgi:hypothetical protein